MCVYSLLIEPQWRFETKLPPTLESDENNKVELECTVQDEDAECDWYFNGEVSFIISTLYLMIYFVGLVLLETSSRFKS